MKILVFFNIFAGNIQQYIDHDNNIRSAEEGRSSTYSCSFYDGFIILIAFLATSYYSNRNNDGNKIDRTSKFDSGPSRSYNDVYV